MMINKVTLLGHKDHGKSTLLGSLLIATRSVTEQRINEARKTSRQLGRQFEPGYILDSFQEERENEMTIDTTRAQIKYKDAAFEFIDVPGHEELIKNMMSGASYADFALLLVSAKPDEGIKDQTKRHLFLAKMMGIKKIVVAVNKMDTVKYNEKRFKEIKSELSEFLERIGFGNEDLDFIPISAYNTENLVEKTSSIKWYLGGSLLDTMYRFAKGSSTERERNKLRIVMQGELPDKKEKTLIGKVICGTVRTNEKVKLVPGNAHYRVKALFVKGAKARSAKTNENIAITLDKKITEDARGHILCSENDNLTATDDIDALVFFTSVIGGNTTIRFNGIEIPAKIDVLAAVDVVTGKTERSKKIKTLNAANVRLSLGESIAAEPFSKTMELGRFVLYSNREFAGIGIIKE